MISQRREILSIPLICPLFGGVGGGRQLALVRKYGEGTARVKIMSYGEGGRGRRGSSKKGFLATAVHAGMEKRLSGW